MKNKSLTLISLLAATSMLLSGFNKRSEKNHSPIVDIILPKNSAVFDWDSFIQYSIRVTDVEDGSTEYEEIPAKEVFLEVTYLPGILREKDKVLQSPGGIDPRGLALLKTSTCFNCHAFKAKFTGPSFFAITKKYPHNAATTEMLANKVIKGSTGVWSNTAMPANPDFTIQQSKQVIQWLLNNAGDPNLNYYTGTGGHFKTVGKPSNGKGTYILKASYIDHGIKGVTKSNAQGESKIILHSK